MDPLAGVGLGANVIQFVEFVTRLVGVAREIGESKNGATVENADLEAATRSIVWLNGRILGSMNECIEPRLGSRAVHDMKDVALACNGVANDLIEALEKLKAGNKKGKWRGLTQAFKTIWTKGQIDSLRGRLDHYRSTMQAALLVSLKDDMQRIAPSLPKEPISNSAADKVKLDFLKTVEESSRDARFHGGDIDSLAFSAMLSTMTKRERELLFKSKILDHLGFQNQLDREHRIAGAHESTFRWVFTNQHREGFQNKQWSDFVSWLQTDDESLYWMTGKAGSGKSTLMKFIIGHNQTSMHLNVWANHLPVIVARFYFWNSGDEEQMSQEGLLRSLLYDALEQRPDEIPAVLAKRWNRWQLFGLDLRSWTMTELIEAFNALVARANGNYKLCLFVDGLDEFEGDKEELIKFFKHATSFSNVKACVSSRPWVVFEEAFVHRPSLMLENLTYPDILDYISAHFNSNSGFVMLQKRELQFTCALIENIAKKSLGVFLWVTLVVKSLLGGMSNYDHTADLQRRLDDLPDDLENFYGKDAQQH